MRHLFTILAGLFLLLALMNSMLSRPVEWDLFAFAITLALLAVAWRPKNDRL